MPEYGFTKELEGTFEAVLDATQEALKAQGFGTLCTIDVEAKFREKLGVEFGKYILLGVCNPAFAHQVLQKDPQIGLLLPCNVVIYQRGGKTIVSVIRPTEAMKIADHPDLEPIASEVEAKLRKAFDAIA